jgi:hypothetical protein
MSVTNGGEPWDTAARLDVLPTDSNQFDKTSKQTMHVERVRIADADKVVDGLPHFSEHVSDDEFVPKSPKTSQFSVIRSFIGIESHTSESYYHSYTVSTSGVHRLASQICHNQLFRKKLQQNILPMNSTEVSSLAAHNTGHH